MIEQKQQEKALYVSEYDKLWAYIENHRERKRDNNETRD